MATFEGPKLVPKLQNVLIFFGQSGKSAGGVGSFSIRFVPFSLADSVAISAKVGNAPFTFPTRLTKILLFPGIASEITLLNVVIPNISGQSVWTISTFSSNGSLLADQVLNVPGPVILGSVVVMETSSVSPRTYGSRASLVTFWFSVSVEIVPNYLIVITPPPGYALIAGSFASIASISGTEVKAAHGTYAIRISRAISAKQEIGFSIRSDLPASVQTITRWRFDIYSLSPTGEASSPVATNDGLFNGFWLIADIPFTVFPSSPTPAALISARISYNVPNEVIASSGSSIRLRLTAPDGFFFSSSTSCLANATSGAAAWTSCVGTRNVANIDRGGSGLLEAGSGSVQLFVTNPTSTPLVNTWQLAVYISNDESLLFTNIGTCAGFGIRAMRASYVGQNRLGFSGVGFFLFQLSAAISSYFTLEITPGDSSGYVISCGSHIVGFKNAPSCASSPAGGGVIITVSQAELNPSFFFTVAVNVINPPSRPAQDASNIFSLSVLDPLGATVDANVNVPGVSLSIVPVIQQGFAYDKAIARTLTNVHFTFSIADSSFTADPTRSFTWLSILVQAPDNFILASASSVKVDPALVLAQPVLAAGNTVTVHLDPKSPLKTGTYSIGFPVMNPGSIPTKNFWVFTLHRGGSQVVFTNVSEGYQFGTVGLHLMFSKPSLSLIRPRSFLSFACIALLLLLN
jgi:hypothetical protein